MEIAEIKSRLSLDQVLSHYGLKADRNGMLCCPFHDDKTPSLKIYEKSQMFKCFGCGAKGDVIEFIQLKERCDKHTAIIKAASLTGNIIEPTPEPKKDDKTLLPRIAVLSKVAQETKGIFKRTAKAKEYIQSRGLDWEKLEVGYIGAEFGKRWGSHLKESGVNLGILKRTRQNTITPKFKSCVLFFTKNEKGQIIDIYLRSVNPTSKAKHFYLNGNHQGIYPNYPPADTNKLILTESIIDCETLLQQKEVTDHYAPIALFGTNGMTPEIESAIKQLPQLSEVILFLDGDEAGNKATLKISERLKEIKPDIKITSVPTPDGEDINNLIQSHEPEIFAHLITNRKPLNAAVAAKSAATGQQVQAQPNAPVLNTSDAKKITYTDGTLNFIIWGGIEKENIHRLKVNLLIGPKNDKLRYYQDDINLYSHAQLQRYIKGASNELEISGTLLKGVIAKLKNELEEYRLKVIGDEQKALKPKPYQMSASEQKEAMRFLKSGSLVKNTMEAIAKSGLIGEQQNGLLLFFLYLSRLFDDPLHAIIFGKSGSGKTYLQTKVSECLPEESVRTITSLTENTLYYSAKDFWKHKVLLIEDLEGVYNAFLPLREFMSKQSINKLTTDKDSKGNNAQKELKTEGPICVSGATTKVNIYEDNANRSFLLHVDESPDHAKKVMDYQRKMQAGLVNEGEQQKYRQLLKNSQRMLRKVKVINPYATMLDIPDCVFKKLRTNMHYLRLIEIITFYHQYQREPKKGGNGKPYITTTPEDIEWANYLIKESLLRKSDELGGQLRHFFETLKSFADKKEEPKTIYAKEVREAFRMNPMTINRYLRELESRGYIQRNGGNRKTGFEYEIKAWNEYEKLKSGINILDEILGKVKAKAVKLPPNSNGKNGSITAKNN
jgi:DNA primase catalytic core